MLVIQRHSPRLRPRCVSESPDCAGPILAAEGKRTPVTYPGDVKARRLSATGIAAAIAVIIGMLLPGAANAQSGSDMIERARSWVAADVGSHIVNPMGAEAQVTGAIIDGLAEAMGQRISFTDGVIEQQNFDTFPLGRISATPDIAISWVITDNAPSGLGEPALPPAIPALTNAIYAASGKRIRELPIQSWS